jgi:hypothetical protein
MILKIREAVLGSVNKLPSTDAGGKLIDDLGEVLAENSRPKLDDNILKKFNSY